VLLECGITAPKRRRKLEQTLTGLLDRPDGTDPGLNPRVLRLVADMRIEWVELDRRIAAYDEKFAAFAKADVTARRLASVPTGVRPRLLGISNRRNKYLGTLLIHGAWALMPALLATTTPLGHWLRGLSERKHENAVIAALANRLVRIVWAVLRRGEAFDVSKLATAQRVGRAPRFGVCGLRMSAGGGSEMA